jgi:DNA-binding MarR family transcriptional regulator
LRQVLHRLRRMAQTSGLKPYVHQQIAIDRDCCQTFAEMSVKAADKVDTATTRYRLDEQVGYLLRRAQQRHLAIFSSLLPDFTPTQFATLAKLAETGPLSQNELGRQASMDAATIKGVVDRLRRRGLITTHREPQDQRRIYLSLSPEGEAHYRAAASKAAEITARTVSGLSDAEHAQLITLLKKLA